jgi:hypothetical protein
MFYSREFLDELFLNKDRELYVRISLLTWDELKIKEIQGLVMDGSLSVDGNSIIRRTLNLTMALDEDSFYLHQTVHDISISRKIQAFIGLKNNTYYGRFPDSVSNDLKFLSDPIIWFNLGMFVPTDISITHDIENSAISISAQDKMVLLNGDIAGQLGYDIDFVNTITNENLPYQTIIKDSVSYFGGIDSSKVLVLDVPFYAESLTTIPTEDFTYTGSGTGGTNQIFFESSVSLANLIVGQTLVQVLTGEVNEGTLPAGATISSISSNSINISSNIVTTGGFVFYVTPATLLYTTNVNNYGKRTFNITNGNPITSGTLLTPSLDPGKILPLQFTLSPKNKDTAIEVSSTDNVTSILDKVKSDLLGEYEYFFDIDGNFIFQFKRNLESQFSSSDLFQNDLGSKYLADFSSIPYIYDFSNKEIVSSYNNVPNWKGIKNDFYVYGANNLLYHLAIDTIPKVPTQFYERSTSGIWGSNLVAYSQPWQQYIIDLTEYNAQVNPSIPENRYYPELKKYFEYNSLENTGIYWKTSSTTGIWRSGNSGETLDYEFVLSLSYEIEYLVIAGGGGGAGANNTSGGGGGAGGYRSSVTGESSGGGASAEGKIIAPIGTSYTITVGAGGAAGAVSGNGGTGSFSIFSTITSTGGGGGGAAGSNGVAGGSGGGAGSFIGTTRTGGSGTTNQGYKGGDVSSGNGSAGGGGASAAGSNGVSSGFTATGGNGISSAITGTNTARAGGGGGYGSAGGSGGGGAGGNLSNGVSGTTNTGGGGGGAQADSITPRTGGAGGSGVVIIRYPSTNFDITSISSGLTYTKTVSGSYKIYTFTQGSGTITI